MKDSTIFILLVAGGALTVTGAYMLMPAVGLIVAGGWLLAFAWFGGRGAGNAENAK